MQFLRPITLTDHFSHPFSAQWHLIDKPLHSFGGGYFSSVRLADSTPLTPLSLVTI